MKLFYVFLPFVITCSLLAQSSVEPGLIGSNYVGIGFTHASNNKLDTTYNGIDLSINTPINEYFDFTLGSNLGVSDSEGGPNMIYTDYLGRSLTFPKHNRWSIGADLGVNVHKEFSIQNNFLKTIDPYFGLGIPLNYYFATEYDVMEYARYGYSYEFGAEFQFLGSFSVTPSYKLRNLWLIQDGVTSDKSERGQYGIKFNYFLSTNSTLQLDYYSEVDTDWNAITLSYLMNM